MTRQTPDGMRNFIPRPAPLWCSYALHPLTSAASPSHNATVGVNPRDASNCKPSAEGRLTHEVWLPIVLLTAFFSFQYFLRLGFVKPYFEKMGDGELPPLLSLRLVCCCPP